MQIIKFKKMSGSKYKVFFSDSSSIVLYEDIILKYNLLANKVVDDALLNQIKEDNNNYMAYDIALKYIKIKLRCESEIIDFLKKKQINSELIENVIKRLKKEGYLNQKLYIKSYINDKLNISNIGPIKIKKELISLGFNEKDIDMQLDEIDKDYILEKLSKLIDKKLSIKSNYSGAILKKKIISYFSEKGYELSDINAVIEEKDFNSNNDINKEYTKLYNKYSKKYAGAKLDSIINQKLYQKAYNYTEM